MTEILCDIDNTFHRRELPAPSIAFSSPQGRILFEEALLDKTMESYFPLAEHFITQGNPSFCGLGSLTMCLNALLIDPKRVWQGVWRWFDESMLSCCDPIELIKLKGLTLSKVACLARCHDAIVHGSNISIDEFRNEVLRVSSQRVDVDERQVIIASYNRQTLNQTGSGHFSPIGGYNRRTDMVFIFDVARFKYPAHWVPLLLLYESMQSIDQVTGKSRGYLLISKSNQPTSNNNCDKLCQYLNEEFETDSLMNLHSCQDCRVSECTNNI